MSKKTQCIIFDDTSVGRRTKAGGMIDCLAFAAAEGRVDDIIKFLDAGEDPNISVGNPRFAELEDTKLGSGTPLHIALHYKQIDAMKVLLDRGADVNAKLPLSQRSLLTAAIASPNIDAVELLLKYKPDLEMKKPKNAVQVALDSKNERIIEMVKKYAEDHKEEDVKEDRCCG
eukprot:PhF_6_TR35101/c0_g1_i1/m.51158